MGMKPREVTAVARDRDGRMIVTTFDGGVNVICGPAVQAVPACLEPPQPAGGLEEEPETAEEAEAAGRPWIGPPDAAGQTGVLFDEVRSGRPAPRGAWIFADPYRPVTTTLWTLADLDQEARWYLSAGRIPSPEREPASRNRRGQQTSEPTWDRWIDGDPIRARAVWLHLAGLRRVPPDEEAVRRIPEAMRCRATIIESGWLSQAETDRL
jgi:hypothetical protein